MDSAVIVTRFLFGALALVMFGLGLSLTAADFQRLLKHPKAVMRRWACRSSACRWCVTPSSRPSGCRRCLPSG